MSIPENPSDGSAPELEAARQEQFEINMAQRRYFNQLRSATPPGGVGLTASGVREPGNWATRAWRRVREVLRLLRHSLGLDKELHRVLMECMGDFSDKRALELGCSRGSFATMELARRGRYTGIDLAETATEDLRHALAKAGLAERATIITADFYEAGFADGAFDLIFAKSVLHHFKCPELLFQELARILAPGGVVVSHDPIQINPVLAMVRALYRPFQSDRKWEWPLTRAGLHAARRYFRITRVEGEGFLELLWLPLLVLLPQGIRRSLYRTLKRIERGIRGLLPVLHYYDMRIVLLLEKRSS